MHKAEQDGQDRKGAHELIDARIADVQPDPGEFGAFDLGFADTTFVVGHADGEIEFTTDSEGNFTPSNEREAWAVKELGGKPGKE